MNNWTLRNCTTDKIVATTGNAYGVDSAIDWAFPIIWDSGRTDDHQLVSPDGQEIILIEWDLVAEAYEMDPEEAEMEDAYWSQFDSDSDLGGIW